MKTDKTQTEREPMKERCKEARQKREGQRSGRSGRNEFVKKPETKGTRIRDIKVATQNEILLQGMLWYSGVLLAGPSAAGSSSQQAQPEKIRDEVGGVKRNTEERREI